jgi:predicted metal-dependent phosphoesterase TrpH
VNAPERTCDFHLHSTASDGLLDPAELGTRAARAGLKTLSLSDHDTTEGLPALLAVAPSLGLEVIPAIELTARVKPGPQGTVHLMGFGVRPGAPRLEAAARTNRLAKRAQIEGVLRRLAKEDQIHLTWEDVAGGRGDEAYVGRNQVASVLIRRGHAKTYRHAFQRYLENRRVPQTAVIDAAEAVAAIHEAGGFAVLAHPTHHDLDAHLRPLLDLGLRGLEVYRPHARGGLLDRIEAAAKEHGLLVTGGSDWHGHHPDPGLGSWRLDPEKVAAFLEAVRG